MRTQIKIVTKILVVIFLLLGIVYYLGWIGRFSNRLHTAISGEVKKENEGWVQKYFDNSMERVESWNTKESAPVINRKSHKSMDIFVEHQEIHNTTDNEVIWDTNKSMESIVEHQELHNTTYNRVINTNSQRSRKDRVESLCKAHHDIIPNNVYGLYYYKVPLYYCSVPKLGTTFLKVFFNKTLHCNGIRGKLAQEDVFSYLNVGDPYARLFSAYKDKLYRPNALSWKKIGEAVVKTVRKKNTTKDAGYDVTFAELVQFVVNCHENGKVLDPHLEPIHKLCNPCKKRFDFIGRKETMSEDLVNLFDILNTAGIVKDKVPVSTLENNMRSHEPSYGVIMAFFHAVEEYPHISVYNLFLRHWAMYHISGIALNQYEMPFSESVVKSISPEQYKEALTSAIESSKDNKEQLRLQRQEALVQAYRSVPLPLMLRLREFVKVDCLLFSYDDKPALLFDRDTHNNDITHVYMKGI